jgi:cell wall-associated NlpC family hydrolase
MFGFRSLPIKRTPGPSDMSGMGGGRLVWVLAAAVASLAVAGPASSADPTPELAQTASAVQAKSWAAPQIASVVLARLMGPDVASFRPDDPLTRAELHAAIVALGKPHQTPLDPMRIVTMRELDAQLVAAAGLLPAARAIRLAATAGGLAPIDMLGTETVARLLGLRVNHPQGSEELERAPKQSATRAEAAYSLAKLRALDPARVAAIQQLAASFSVPALTDLQREVLARALRFVGYPYVFAGTSEKTQKLWSATALGNTVTVPGGFDCSGFVWRIYKLQPFDDAPALAAVLRGRTSYAMSGEVATPLRIAPASLQPADVLFFGAHGPTSKPSEVGHMGIYVGNGWFVHSSSGGVTLQPLQGWYATTLAWARRPLAEAGVAA